MQGGIMRKTFQARNVVIIKIQLLELIKSLKAFDSYDLIALQLEDLQFFQNRQPFKLCYMIMSKMEID